MFAKSLNDCTQTNVINEAVLRDLQAKESPNAISLVEVVSIIRKTIEAQGKKANESLVRAIIWKLIDDEAIELTPDRHVIIKIAKI